MRVVRSTWRKTVAVALVSIGLAAGASVLHSSVAQATNESDERYIVALTHLDDRDEVDRLRLAQLFYRAASALDNGKRRLQALQSRIALRAPGRETVVNLASVQYRDYEALLGRFKHSASAFSDAPDSNLLLYRVLMHGHKSCWHLDRYTGMLRSYGVSADDFVTVLPSGAACSMFRRAAYQPRVTALVDEQLVAQDYDTQEVVELREELMALERLLEDLRKIDQAE